MPPDAAAASKDCAKCRSRRIRCDRSQPGCRKCASRGFSCPGYGITLRWVQGMATRGRLAGQHPPIPAIEFPRELPSFVTFPDDGSAISGDMDLVHHLLRHFDTSVATKLAWVDGPDNPWRNIILPLSTSSATVFFAVLAMASEDLTYRCGSQHPDFRTFQLASLHYRHRTLSSLSQQLAMLRTSADSPTGALPARYLLASTLLLYNLELLAADDAQWRLHIQGARAILQQTTNLLSSPDKIDIFLLYEYYYTSVFIGLTTFDPIDEIPSPVPTNDTITIFSDFVHIIHTVTQAERVKFTSTTSLETTIEQPTTEELEDHTQLSAVMQALAAAKTRTIQTSRTIQFKYQDAWSDFEHLTHMYYHAGVIYSQRALSGSMCENTLTRDREVIRSSRDAVLDHLSRLTRRAYFAQDLVWPLFIAGTECRGCPEMQDLVYHAMMAVIEISGHLDRRRVVSFLRMFWGVDADPGISWMQLARQQPIDCGFLIL